MENRGQKYHRDRVGEALREEIAALVEGELGDPRIGLVSVSEVHLAPGGKTARVFIVAAGDDSEAEESIAGLNAARGYIRHELTGAGIAARAGNCFCARPLGAVRRQNRRTAASNSEEEERHVAVSF